MLKNKQFNLNNKKLKKYLPAVLFVFVFLLPLKFALADCAWFGTGKCSDIDSSCTASTNDSFCNPNSGIQSNKASTTAKYGKATCCCCNPNPGCCTKKSQGVYNYSTVTAAKCGGEAWMYDQDQSGDLTFFTGYVAKNNQGCEKNVCCYCNSLNNVEFSFVNTESECTAKGSLAHPCHAVVGGIPGKDSSGVSKCVAVETRASEVYQPGCCECTDPSTPGEVAISKSLAVVTKNKEKCLIEKQNAVTNRNCNFYETKAPNSDSTKCVDKVVALDTKVDITTPTSSTNQIVNTGPKWITMPNPIGITNIAVLIGVLIKNFLAVLGSIALLMFIWGALQWMLAMGNMTKVAKGTQTMLWAALGIGIISFSYVLVRLLIEALGVK